MDTQKLVFINPIHLTITGSLNSAYLLGKIIDWNNINEGRDFHNTDQDLADQLCIGLDSLKSAKSKLKRLGIITTSLKGIPAKTHYKLNCRVLETLERRAESSVEINEISTHSKWAL
jgi:hypothetical protein